MEKLYQDQCRLLSANNLTSNRPKSVILGKVGAQFMIWRYLEGHIRRDCELYETDQARRDFGSYAPEIIEGRKTTELIFTFTHIICSQTHNNFINHAVCIF
jgi:hypothetical protein